MNRFLAQLGRSKYIELVMPSITCAVTTIYAGVQFGYHDQLRDLLAAQTPSGRRETLSAHLKELIQQTHQECSANGFNDSIKALPHTSLPTCDLKWFASSTLEPITFGCTKFAFGVLIGVPNFFNYTSPNDIPDSMFEVKMLSLFRSVQDVEQEKRLKLERKSRSDDEESKLLGPRRIKRDSTEGEEYTESLLLSDDAKKFAMARELYLVDTYRPVIKCLIVFGSLSTSISVARTFIKRFDLRSGHVTRRIPVYMTSALLAWGLNHFASIVNDQLHAREADKKARKISASYQSGAEEYYTKRAKRKQILG